MSIGGHEVHETHRLVSIPADGEVLEGDLAMPVSSAHGIVLFAHGSGSGRHSPRNRFVAQELRTRAHVGTLLFDLLSTEEEAFDLRTASLRFDIELLAARLLAATDWLLVDQRAGPVKIGYFGASTGAGAALVAAASRPSGVSAVVSRGGRSDLAGDALEHVRAPTLFIAGDEDPIIVALNRDSLARMKCEAALAIVPGASHLFEEPGALGEVARLAGDWFARWL
jgi:dienelactone hydrolase